LCRDRYRHLAAVVPFLFREYCTTDIFIDDHEIGNGAFRSLLTLLNVLIPIWKTEEKSIIKPGDTLSLY
jgi:hypothetical protein